MSTAPLSADGTVTIRVEEGDLELEGTDGLEVRVERPADSDPELEPPEVVPDGTGVTVKAVGSITVTVPRGARVHIAGVEGDLAARNIAALAADGVGGDAACAGIARDLVLHGVGCDVAIDGVGGSVEVRAGGDAALHAVAGAFQAFAGGDVAVSFTPAAGADYALTAGGDVACHVPGDANLEVRATAGGEIVVAGPTQRAARSDYMRVFTLGSGGALLTVTAGGDIAFATAGERARTPEAAGAAPRRGALPGLIARTLAPLKSPTPPRAPAPAADDERTMVLRMLSSGTITADEAQRLLAALEMAPKG